jgi:hypothetical protein
MRADEIIGGGEVITRLSDVRRGIGKPIAGKERARNSRHYCATKTVVRNERPGAGLPLSRIGRPDSVHVAERDGIGDIFTLDRRHFTAIGFTAGGD